MSSTSEIANTVLSESNGKSPVRLARPKSLEQIESDGIKLQNAWSFWHDKFIGPNQSVEDYEKNLQELFSFSTIQGFWTCFNNLPTPDKLKAKSSYHMMKTGIRPIWEDPNNADGGFWAMRVKKEDTTKVWKELVLAVIGEQFSMFLEPGDDVCGITVSIRAYDNIIELWTHNATLRSKNIFKKITQIMPDVELKNPYYKGHREHANFNKVPENGKSNDAHNSDDTM